MGTAYTKKRHKLTNADYLYIPFHETIVSKSSKWSRLNPIEDVLGMVSKRRWRQRALA